MDEVNRAIALPMEHGPASGTDSGGQLRELFTTAEQRPTGHDLAYLGALGKLAVGADKDLLDDLRDLPFGAYGHLADRYGVHWFFRGAPRSATPPTSKPGDASKRGDP
jgi:hypothetical protein